MTMTDGNARDVFVSGRIRRRSAVYAGVLALAVSAIVVATPSGVPVVAQSSGVVTNVTELYAAVAAANSVTGATITMAPGTYQLTTPLVVRGRNTRIEGAAKPVAFDASTRTFDPGAATVVRGTGQAIIIDANGVTITGVAITGANGGTKSGGAIAVNRNRNGFVLSQSTIVGNTAGEGGGVFVERNAAARIERSTFIGNTTPGKGGGVRVAGSVDVVNSTFTDNAAQSGGAMSVAGSATVSYSTFVDNTSNNSKGGGVDRNGGNLAVTGSILTRALQGGSDGSDCSGTPDLVGVNFVGNTQGCNPGPATLTQASNGALRLGPLADNGGPTRTIAQLDGSPAVDAGPAVCRAVTSGQTATNDPNGAAITTDQRGLSRPSNATDGTPTRCDLGAYEQASLSVDAALTVDTGRYDAAPYDLDPGTVEVGVVSVPTSQIAFELATRTPTNDDGTVNTAGLRSIGLRSIGLRSITLEDIGLRSIDPNATGLRSIDVKASGLRSIGLRSIGLRSIGLRSIGLRSIGLRSIGLRSIPLSEIPLLQAGGWSEFLEGTEFEGVPLQSITLEDIAGEVPESFTLESIDLSSTGLRSIGLRSILLAGIGLRSIPLPTGAGADGNYAAEWCDLLFGADLCANPDDPNFVLDVGDLELWEAQLFGADIDQQEVLEVPLGGLNDALVEAENLQSTGLRSIGLRSIGLRSIFLENTGLRSIGLRSIGLRSIGGLGTIIDCSAAGEPCSTAETNTLTLGDVVAGCLPPELIGEPGYSDPTTCLLNTGATLGDLFDLLGTPFDEDGDGDTETLLDGLNLFDILFAFVAPEAVPWEVIELDGALLQNIADPLQPTFDYLTEVTVREGPADLDIQLNLPNGFAVATPVPSDSTTTTTWCPTAASNCTDAITPRTPLTLGRPTYSITGVPSGVYVLKVPVRAGLTVGSSDDFPAMATVSATGPNGSPPATVAGPVGVNVVEASSGGPGRAPILQDGQLQLGHITRTDDLDVYQFSVVDDALVTGSSARVLLSNIPEGVDYDLAVYGPRPVSLRGTPTDARSALVEASFDLDPDDDVLPTDVVDDIAVDINAIAAADPNDDFSLGAPYALRDISSRRSNNDEEVTIPAVVAGETYIIAVSSYYNDLSAEPYGLRVRLDGRNAIPECAPRTTPYPNPSVVAPGNNPLPVGPDTNTLYVTNLSRLAAENGGSVAGIVDGIVGTDGVNGVRAGILQVDELPAWSTWNTDRCEPDARNAVVSAIGAAIDGAIAASGATIEHIVLVGGDGVIPMAAVPDLTEYSNESTFARELLTSSATNPGKSNEAVAALASGHLLSDDPYATDAGISILGGDHELYLPERSIGRLVERTAEIADQLENFATFGGTLDPATFNTSAAVTAYDFLDDGGDAIAEELAAGGFVVDQLRGDVWDREDYLDLLAGTDRTGTDRKIVSPNAHYDFESLLPAAADSIGYFTDEQLVTTADVAGLGDGFDSLVFTVGCHAGFSVADVQLQHPALDWAQLNAQNTNQFVAHTTYGYGDTTIVAYSERLAKLFAENVAAMADPTATSQASLGQAVRDAKERYLAGTLVLTPYDEKILQSWTYYGLPMYTLGDVGDPSSGSRTSETTTSGELAGAMSALATPAGPADFTQANGRTTVDIDLSGDALELVPVDEDRNGTPDSSYYQVDGNAIVAQYRPVQPLVDVEIPVTGTYQGFLVTGLTTEDLPQGYVPFYSNPLIDNSVNETRIVVGDGAFPATLQRVNDVTDGQRLLVAAGEFESGQRLFRRISGELIPRTKAGDDVAARFLDVVGLRVANVGSGGEGVQFDVLTDDDAVRAFVLYREFGTTEWRPVELAGQAAAGGTRRWFGSAPLRTSGKDVEFFVQNVDDAGNVGLSRNKIENFSTSDADDPAVLGIRYVGPADKEFAGRYYPSGAVFEIVEGSTETRFSIDSGPLLDYNPTTGITIRYADDATGAYDPVTGVLDIDRGPHVLFAEEGGARVYRFLILDPDAPTVEVIASTTDWADGSVDVTITATDSGAGVASIAYDCGGGGTCEDITPDDAEATAKVVRVTGEGVTTVSATATDNVGNVSAEPSTVDVRIDATAPVVTVVPATTDWSPASVDVTITATDAGSGVGSITFGCGTGTCTEASSVPDTGTGVASKVIRVSSEGVTTVSATATDNTGNASVAPSTAEVRVDLTAPTITSFTITPDADGDGIYTLGEPVTVTFSCADAQSGLASCELFDGTTPVAGPYTIDTSTPGTRNLTVKATDLVGRTTTSAMTTVTVAYDICLLYDPTQVKNIGSNYTIKLRLCDANGNNLSNRQTTLTALTVDGTTDPGPNFSGNANAGYEFRFSQGDRSYIYNLDTTRLEPGAHKLYFTTRTVTPRPTDPIALQAFVDTAPAPFELR